MLCVSVATLAAWSLNRMRWRAWVVNAFLGWTLVFNMIPPVALASAWYTMTRTVGLDNSFLALILAHTTLNLPMAIWLMSVFVRDVPKELEEAARIDGATRRCCCATWCCPSSRRDSPPRPVSASFSAGTNSPSRLTCRQTVGDRAGGDRKVRPGFRNSIHADGRQRRAVDPAGAGAASGRATLHRHGPDPGAVK